MGVSNPSPRPDHRVQRSSTRKINPITSVYKNWWGLQWQKKLPDFQESPFKGLHRLKTYTNPLTLEFTTRATAGRAPVIYWKWVK